MKDKILYLIIGILIGAMIATGVFMVINKNSNNGPVRNFRNFDANNLPEGVQMIDGMPQGRPGEGGTGTVIQGQPLNETI